MQQQQWRWKRVGNRVAVNKKPAKEHRNENKRHFLILHFELMNMKAHAFSHKQIYGWWMWKQFTIRCKAFSQWLKKFWVAAFFLSSNEKWRRRAKKEKEEDEKRVIITAKTETKATIQCEVYRDSKRVARERWATAVVSWVRKGEKAKEEKTASNTVELSQIFRTKNSG